MSIRATRLSAYRYRSFDSYELELAPGMTVLVGRNAVGKTNLVEALQLLTAGQSFRKPSPAELLREGAERGSIELELRGEGRVLQMSCSLQPRARSFSRNGKRTRPAGIRGVLPSVLFCPDHLDICKRSASVRRAALDDFGIQLNEQYAKLASAYERTVEQRNTLLRDGCVSPDLLEVWDDALARAGASLLMHRRALLGRIREHFVDIYRAIAPHERADVAYVASIGEFGGERDEAAARFRQALAEVRGDELRRGVTLVGPHRDELLFTIDGRSARDFGSQGQQRSIVLSWKMAEVRVTRDILGRYPLLLLDDVMSELDGERRDAIMGFVADGIQTVVTTTNLGYFSQGVLDAAKVVRVGER